MEEKLMLGRQSKVSSEMENKLMLLTMVLLIMLISHCDAECLNVTTGFRTNLRTLLDFLSKTAPFRDGFYETSVGNNSDRVYGMVQCKANISSNACTTCLKSSTGSISIDGCQESTGIESLSSFCTFRYSVDNFFGEWSNTSTASFSNNGGLDEPLVFSKGFSMMEGLATTVPYQPLMYQAAQVDVGDYGKRYGLGQCSRDLSKSNCRNCLEDRLVRYRSFVENRTEWEILGTSCSMWYDNGLVAVTPDLTAPTPSDQTRLPPGKPSVTSGSRRCEVGFKVETKITLKMGTLTLLATLVFAFLS